MEIIVIAVIQKEVKNLYGAMLETQKTRKKSYAIQLVNQKMRVLVIVRMEMKHLVELMTLHIEDANM